MIKHIRIKASNISKKFCFNTERSNQFKDFFLNPFKAMKKTEFIAVKNISFDIYDGEFVGLIGRNGSGKSTILKMLAGIYEPDSGNIEIHGKLIPFLELGVGFNYELTARENIYLNGTILGLSKSEIDKKFNTIIKFAELQEFVNLPLKNFSSGMAVRLAFAIAIHVEAEIYLLDEVLAVGDSLFQKKCVKVFQKFKKEKKTIIFVSHDLNAINKFCNRSILIDDHEIKIDGNPKIVTKEYLDILGIDSKQTK